MLSSLLLLGNVHWTEFGRREEHSIELWISDWGSDSILAIYILFPFVCVNERNCIWFIYGLQKEKTIETTYSTNPKSMMQVSFFSNLLSVSQHFLQPYWFQYVNSLVIFAEPLLCCFLDYEKEISNSEGGFA